MKRKNIDDMTSAEMEAFENRIMKRLLWLNALWLVAVLVVLFLFPAIGVILLIVTGLKYFWDYHDVESQARYVQFLLKRYKERNKE